MQKLFHTGLIWFCFAAFTHAQHFIGLNKDEATILAKQSGFFADNMTTSQKFNYLKFINSANTKTLIIFFSENNHATNTRLVCDYGEYDGVLKEMNEKYKNPVANKWEYKIKNELFEITMEEKEWYFVVRTKKK